ncbi:MAG: hypothetical protein LQ341_006454 [Variospora aurantia]|nr:MAG: hypothetical protein LQ341_006454 [Variospora aurantia]
MTGEEIQKLMLANLTVNDPQDTIPPATKRQRKKTGGPSANKRVPRGAPPQAKESGTTSVPRPKRRAPRGNKDAPNKPRVKSKGKGPPKLVGVNERSTQSLSGLRSSPSASLPRSFPSASLSRSSPSASLSQSPLPPPNPEAQEDIRNPQDVVIHATNDLEVAKSRIDGIDKRLDEHTERMDQLATVTAEVKTDNATVTSRLLTHTQTQRRYWEAQIENTKKLSASIRILEESLEAEKRCREAADTKIATLELEAQRAKAQAAADKREMQEAFMWLKGQFREKFPKKPEAEVDVNRATKSA